MWVLRKRAFKCFDGRGWCDELDIFRSDQLRNIYSASLAPAESSHKFAILEPIFVTSKRHRYNKFLGRTRLFSQSCMDSKGNSVPACEPCIMGWTNKYIDSSVLTCNAHTVAPIERIPYHRPVCYWY